MQQLRNCVLIALAMDATPQEVEHAHDIIDRIYGAAGDAGGVNPQYLVTGSVPATDANGVTAHGQQTNNASATEVDKTGLPWDERIHSSSKDNRMNADGTWRSKRGVDPKYKAKIESELRATLGATAPAPTPTATSTPQATPPLPGGNLPPMPGAAVVDPAYAALVQFIATNTQSQANPAGRLTDEYVKQVLTHYGIADGSLQNLAHRPDLVPTVSDWLHQVLA